ncbi:hypothetical protein I2W78_13170 [Streptomyces spinoverrucosus]|uniref:hypothetical protein n=1 Tax=Streptomyces spinoverrucosus TaxID=284043 RepID=UPI0018C3F1D3|nr:hypothetical protein [Streptomyces spinoverrucosus]MBG0852763.1 hypothetical protein [Streptomyces spinoverrucosus]
MRTSFRIHAGAQLALCVAGLLAASLATLPFLPPFADEWLLLGIALLVPLHVATIVRSIAVGLRDMRFASSKANQWRALRSLPRRVQGLLAGVGLAGVTLLVGARADDSSLHKADSVRGRYFAIDTSHPHRERIQITRSEYEALRKQDQQVAFAAYALVAASGGGLTLVFAKLDTWAGKA